MSTSQLHHGTTPDVLPLPPSFAISDEVLNAAERLGVGQYLAEVAAFTVEIFGSFLNVELVPDPEVPDWEHIIFKVPVTGTAESISQRQITWCRRLLATIQRAPSVYSIAMSYQE
jgi:hypothetical protein